MLDASIICMWFLDNVVTSKVGNVTEKELSKNYDNNMEKVLYIK